MPRTSSILRTTGKDRHAVIAILAMLAATLLTGPALASRDSDRHWSRLPQLCEQAAAQASRSTSVPLDVLRAIALTETGRTRNGSFRPWPWTVNMEGKGEWFDTYEQARDYVRAHRARGATSFDVGCFQINYRWHGKHFASLEQMFDPGANAAYAARFLTELYDELGDWSRAAGAYHSRTPQYATRYRARFDRIRARLGDSGPAPPAERQAATPKPAAPAQPATSKPVAVRDNRYPLLLSTGAQRGLASLVPLEILGSRRLIDAQSR